MPATRTAAIRIPSTIHPHGVELAVVFVGIEVVVGSVVLGGGAVVVVEVLVVVAGSVVVVVGGAVVVVAGSVVVVAGSVVVVTGSLAAISVAPLPATSASGPVATGPETDGRGALGAAAATPAHPIRMAAEARTSAPALT